LWNRQFTTRYLVFSARNPVFSTGNPVFSAGNPVFFAGNPVFPQGTLFFPQGILFFSQGILFFSQGILFFSQGILFFPQAIFLALPGIGRNLQAIRLFLGRIIDFYRPSAKSLKQASFFQVKSSPIVKLILFPPSLLQQQRAFFPLL